MAIKVTAQGKTFTFPDGTSQQDIGAAIDNFFTAEQAPAGIRRADNQATMQQQEQLAAFDRANQLETEQRQQDTIPSTGQSLFIGIGKGMNDVGSFIKKGALKLVGDEEGLAQQAGLREAAGVEFEQLKQDKPISAGTGEIIGQTVATLPAGGPAASLGRGAAARVIPKIAGQRAATVAGLAGAGAAEGAVVSALIDQNAAEGAGIGAAASILMPTLLRNTSTVFKKLLGRQPKSRIFDATGNITNEAKAELKNAGIPFETFSDEVSDSLKTSFANDTDLAAQVRQLQLDEFVPGVQAKPSRLAQDFATQGAEEQLVAAGTPIGQNLVNAERQIQEGLLAAGQKNLLGDIDSTLISRFESPSDDTIKALSGRSVKEAIGSIKAADKKAVTNLYNAARDLAGNGVALDGSSLKNVFEQQMVELVPDEKVSQAVGNALKEFGVFAGDEAQEGLFKVAPSQTIKDLTLDNAEKLRQRLNRLNPPNPTDQKFLSEIKNVLDNQVNNLIDEFPQDSASASAFLKARGASADYFRNFENKDFIQDVIANKAGSTTSKISEERVTDFLLGSKDLSQIQKLKSILIESPNAASKAAWSDIQFSTIDDILRRSVTPTTGELSGQRLVTTLKNYGDSKLKLILGPDKFAQIKRFEQVAKDQTIPLIRAANASGTAGVLTEKQSAVFDPIINIFKRVGDVQTGGLVTQASKAKAQRDAIKNAATVVDSSLQQTARARKIKSNKALVDYISGLLVPVTVVGAQNDSN